MVLAFWISILITIILKIIIICFKTNDLFECAVKLTKFHKTKVKEKREMIKLEDLLKIKE